MSDPKLLVHDHLLHDSPTLSIYYDPVHDWIYMDWKGQQSVESIKAGCNLLLGFLKSERCKKVLNDNTRVTNIWSDAAPWIAREFFPKAAQAGLTYIAWIYSPDQFSRLSTDEVMALNQEKIATIPFNNYEDAVQWFSSVQC
jgi:hypothetical protein